MNLDGIRKLSSPELTDFLAQEGVQFSPPGAGPVQFWPGQRKVISDSVTGDAVVSWPSAGIPATAANNSFFEASFQFLDPQTVPILFGPLTADEAFGTRVVGSLPDKYISWADVEYTGTTQAYDDYNAPVTADANWQGNTRETHREMTGVQYGMREVERASAAKWDIVSSKRQSSALQLKKFINGAAYYGISGSQLYGAFTDPNLLPAISPTAWTNEDTPTGSLTKWEQKTGFMIYSDMLALKNQIVAQSMGLLSLTGAAAKLKWKLVVASNVQTYLDQTNKFSFDIEEHLRKLFGGADRYEIVTAPELNATPGGAGNMMFLYVEEFEGVRTLYNAIQGRMIEGFIERRSTSWNQSVWAQTAGLIVKRPILFATMKGI